MALLCLQEEELFAPKVNNFQFSILKEWKASKREIYSTKCNGQNVWW